MSTDNEKIWELERELIRRDAQIEVLKDTIIGLTKATTTNQDECKSLSERAIEVLGSMTIKQHAALQCVLAGLSNKQIAELFQCTDSTAKVHVRGVMGKLDAHTRSQVVLKAQPLMDAIGPEKYLELTGLSKGWVGNVDDEVEITRLVREKTR